MFDFEITELPVNFTGKRRGRDGGQRLAARADLASAQGDTVTIRVRNGLSEMSAIHWHGPIVPADMDGVPGISFPGIAPGETFTYRFELRQSGAYWYHAHTLAEQTGLCGAIIVEPRAPEVARPDRDYTVMLSDWTDEALASGLPESEETERLLQFRPATRSGISSRTPRRWELAGGLASRRW
ncbi:multicopper oxidase domain-containing protein [Caulobacter segnis]